MTLGKPLYHSNLNSCLYYTWAANVLSHFSRVQLFETPWTVAHQAPLSMGFSRQEYWSGLLLPSPGDLPHPGIKPESPVAPASEADSLPLSSRGNPLYMGMIHKFYVKELR